MWETVELREIRVFMVLAEELHFGLTAQRLGISQSRVSQAVRSLEEQLGRRLFDRTSRRVQLTPAGRDLLERVSGPHAELRDALAAAYRRADRIEGVLTVAMVSPTSQGPHLVDIVSAFRTRHPHCEVIVAEAAGFRSLSVLRDGKADILTSWLPIHASDIVIGPIINVEERVLSVARDHPLAGRESVTLEDVADFAVIPEVPMLPTEVYEAIVPRAAPSGRPIPRYQRAPQTSAEGIALVALGTVVHPTVPSVLRHFGHPNVIAIPLEGMPPLRSALLWRNPPDPRVEAFVEIAREVLPEPTS